MPATTTATHDANALDWLKQKVVEIQQYRAHDRKDLNALQDENQELRQEVQELRDRVATLEERTPSPSQKAYDEMDKSDKATVLREALKRQARKGGGAAMKYKDVMHVFESHPSAGHVYDIMEAADDGAEFRYGRDPEGERRLTYDEGRTP